MKSKILKAYEDGIKESAKADGTKPRAMTANDERVAVIAATFSESDLRHAVVMRAAYERKLATANRQLVAEPAIAKESQK